MKPSLDVIQFFYNLTQELLHIENIYYFYLADLLLFFIFYPVLRFNI